jgi:hypothetical protein
MNTSVDKLRTRNLRTVGVLAALFLLPLALSFWMYYGAEWHPTGRTNHGDLIQPPRPLPLAQLPDAAALRDKWSLVYIGRGECDTACRNALILMRQTRLSLNNEMTRVNRVLLADGGCCDREFLDHEHPGLIVLDALPAQALLHSFPTKDRADSVFVVDPLGNLMMRYDARDNPKGLLQDLQKLLKLSHIG